jgi:hypothetical protein
VLPEEQRELERAGEPASQRARESGELERGAKEPEREPARRPATNNNEPEN